MRAIADGAAAGRPSDFFRSPQFLAAEGVTHTLRIEQAAPSCWRR